MPRRPSRSASPFLGPPRALTPPPQSTHSSLYTSDAAASSRCRAHAPHFRQRGFPGCSGLRSLARRVGSRRSLGSPPGNGVLWKMSD
eukprot:3932785-Pleurochrysis_carterae.AAC.4